MSFFRVIAVFLLIFPLSAAAQEQVSRTIVVSGEGVESAAPDMATIQLGVTEEADSAAEAMERASVAMAAILETLAESGVEARDVQTSNINLSPRYGRPQDNTPPRVNGYIASNMVSVRVRDLEALGGVLDALVRDGANAINGIGFSIADTAALEAEARSQAVADARAKAETLAAAAAVTLGPVQEIREGGSVTPPPLMRGLAMAESAVPIAGGEVDVRVSVSVVFAIGD